MGDKCLKNEIADMAVINMPPDLNVVKYNRRGEPVEENCEVFVYATYLPAGRHQFLIYCPVRKKVFVKDVVIDLNSLDVYPEFPAKIAEIANGQAVIRQDVWRKWRVDSEEDIILAFTEDIKEQFNPELFLRDKEDSERSKDILLENFEIL